MRVWVDDKFAFRSEPVLVEFNDYTMNADDVQSDLQPIPVVR